jgi:hypothetical protein
MEILAALRASNRGVASILDSGTKAAIFRPVGVLGTGQTD